MDTDNMSDTDNKNTLGETADADNLLPSTDAHGHTTTAPTTTDRMDTADNFTKTTDKNDADNQDTPAADAPTNNDHDTTTAVTADSDTSVNTTAPTPKTTFDQWLPDDHKWMPLKISWLCKLPLNDSLHTPDSLMTESDEAPQDNHPCISKIAQFIDTAKQAHEYPIHIRSSKRNKIFSLKELQQPWSTNDFKFNFEYSTVRDRMQITFWVMAPTTMTYRMFKQPTMKRLHKGNIWVEHHKTSMTELDTSLLGWFCEAHYPNACHHDKFATEINSLLAAHFHENKSTLLPFAHTFPTLHGWTGDTAPTVIVGTVKPKWRKGGQYVTRAIGLRTPKRFRALVRRMLQELDLTLNNGKATFVDLNMQHGGQALHSEYGKLLFKQQAYIQHHEVHNLFGITISTMRQLALESIPGVVSIETTP
ncbi:MAG: hypothetical protein GY923_18350, partial [Aestuariibacter sp.]|nr:hypothetical protein [Aestuariibacter sp.]